MEMNICMDTSGGDDVIEITEALESLDLSPIQNGVLKAYFKSWIAATSQHQNSSFYTMETNNEDFLCGRCKKFINSKIFTCHSVIYCESCLEKAGEDAGKENKCKACQNKIKDHPELFQTFYKYINQLSFHCRNIEFGCKDKFNRKDLGDHEPNCPKRFAFCSQLLGLKSSGHHDLYSRNLKYLTSHLKDIHPNEFKAIAVGNSEFTLKFVIDQRLNVHVDKKSLGIFVLQPEGTGVLKGDTIIGARYDPTPGLISFYAVAVDREVSTELIQLSFMKNEMSQDAKKMVIMVAPILNSQAYFWPKITTESLNKYAEREQEGSATTLSVKCKVIQILN